MGYLRRFFLPVLAFLLLLAAVLVSFSTTPALAQDCTTASISRVSVASGGAQGNGDSYLSGYQTISADGRYVVFTSSSVLVPEDTNVCGYFSCGDVYMHDRQTGQTERVSLATGGAQGNRASGDGVITPDGRYVAFSSEADNLVSGDTNGVRDIFVHDRQTGETRRVSLDSVGNQANNYSDYPVISGDGQIIAFQSYASNLVSDDTNGVEDIFVHDLQNSTTTRISVSSTGTQGNGWSTTPAMSANGQFVIFESRATNLVEGDYDGQLYLHDRQTGTTSIVSVNSTNEAAAGFVLKGSISDDGRFVAFHSDATNLAFGYTPDYWFDIFLHDRLTGETSLFAENPDAGRQFTEGSSTISFSQDERYLAFASTAANPGSDSILGEYDVFILDTQTGQTKIATHSWDAESPYIGSFSPSISADGKYVVFDSWQENLVQGDTNLQRDVFVASVDCLPLDPTPTPTEEVTPESTPVETATPEVTPTEEVTPEATPTEDVTPEATPTEEATPEVTPTPVCPTSFITRAAVASDGIPGNGASSSPHISADGRYIFYASEADNLVLADTNNLADLFMYDRQTRQTTLVSTASDGTQANGSTYLSSVSANGQLVAFTSYASNLVPDDTNNQDDIFVHDLQTGHTERVSVASDGTQANGPSFNASALSDNGLGVAFVSAASNLVPGDSNNSSDIFVYDRQTGKTERVSVATDRTQGNGGSSYPAISANGRFVAFVSIASNLVPSDTNNTEDIFVHDRVTGQTSRASITSDGTQANGRSFNTPVLSPEGRYIFFESKATNLVDGDTNNTWDVFVHDHEIGQTTRVSIAYDGAQANNASQRPSLSANGRYLAFGSWASNLVPDDVNGFMDIFVHDRETGEIILVSTTADGVQGNGHSSFPSISASGNVVAFDSDAHNLVPGGTNPKSDVFVVELGCPVQPTPTPTAEITPEETPTEEVTPEATPTEEATPEVTPTEETTPEITPEVTQTEEATPEVTPTAAPTSPPNAVPQRNYVTTQPITLAWNPVTWAVRYQVQVDVRTAFTAPIMDAPTPELQLPPLEPRTYFWRVRAIRANNTPGAWSAIETFTVGMP